MLNTQNIIDKLKNQGIEADASQIKLITELVELNIEKKGFLKTYLTNNIKKSGIYIWGDVGRGKTLISKTYLKSIGRDDHKSFHYIELMDFIHNELNLNSGHKNPLKKVATKLTKNTSQQDKSILAKPKVSKPLQHVNISDLLTAHKKGNKNE